jgi:segregation and condensation protein A
MNDIRNDIYKAELEGVKAPLGVILFFIKRDNLDIYDIPIAKITKDYLAYLDMMEQLQIDLAGDFFVLAATLMRIKVQMLLRRDDDEEDPREELVRNLIEYKKMVEAARSFQELETERLKVFSRTVPHEEKEFRGEPVLELNLFEIMRAFRQIIAEYSTREGTEIEPEEFTLEEKIDAIESVLREHEQVLFRELFQGSSSRLEVIVTFMALLELIKRAVVRSRQEGAFGEIWIYRAEPPMNDAVDAGEAS